MRTPDTSQRLRDDETSLAARAAWLHFAGGLTQGEVAERLGIASLKAHRLIARATREGLIHVYIDGEISECVRLEEQLCAAYGLTFCEVAPDIGGEALPLKVLGIAGSRFLHRAIERGDDKIIGVGHGRTLAAAIDHLPRSAAAGIRFVSLIGGLTRKFAANPYDVMHRLAERTGAEAYVLPLPFFANSAADRAVLMAQRGVGDVFDLARQASLLFVGIGTVDQDASPVTTGMVEYEELDEVRRAGACGELLGHFFDIAGRPIENGLTERALSLGLEDIRGRKTVAVGGGRTKAPAIRAILESRILHGLITDERTARELVGTSPG